MGRSTSYGFTLIELMLVVTIVAIISAIAYPSFKEYVRSARRADAQSSLEQLRLQQAKWRANNRTYGALGNVWTNGTDSLEGYYRIGIVEGSVTAIAFTATATPTGDQANDDCGTFAINQDGPVGGGAYADLAECWR